MKYIEVKNEELIDAVKRKYELVDNSVGLKSELDVIRDKGLEINLEIGFVKDKINELMKDEVASLELDEFEEEGSTEMIDGVVKFAVIDKLSNAKRALREDKENRERRARGEFTDMELVEKKKSDFLVLVNGIEEKGLNIKDLNVLLDGLMEVLK